MYVYVPPAPVHVREEKQPLPLQKHGRFDYLDIGSSSERGNGSSPHSDQSAELEKEISAYRAEEPIDKDADPLDWWRLNSHRFKTLSRLGQKFCVYLQLLYP